MLLIAGSTTTVALAWFLATSAMVLITLMYPRLFAAGQVTPDHFRAYLRRHLEDSEARSLLDRIEMSWRSQRDLLRGLVDIIKLENGVVVPSEFPIDLGQSI